MIAMAPTIEIAKRSTTGLQDEFEPATKKRPALSGRATGAENATKDPGCAPKSPKTHRLLICLNKIRASLAIGGPLFSAGRYPQSKALFARVINELLGASNRMCLEEDQLAALDAGIRRSKTDGLEEDARAWALRMALDTVYDANVMGVIGDDGVYFRPYYHSVRDVLNKALTDSDSGPAMHLNGQLLAVVNGSLADQSLHLPAGVVKSLNEAITAAATADNEVAAFKSLKTALFMLYDAIRLPDLNPANRKEQISTVKRSARATMLIDFCGDLGKELASPFTPYLMTDSVMGGMSLATFDSATTASPFAVFKGSLSTVNGGGFASVRFTPNKSESFHSAIDGCAGFVIVIKCTGSEPLKLKMKLASEKRMRAFNWQSEFTVPNGEFSTIKLDIDSFWPNLFGHVVSDRGSVDFTKVDSLGFMVSRMSDDATSNQNFREGNFEVSIKSIAVIGSASSAV